MSTVQHPSAEELQHLINTEKRPLLLVFSAQWCGPCKAAAPMVEAFAAKHADAAVVAKLDVDEHPEIAARFLVRAVPTYIALQDGNVLGMQSGGANPASLARLIG